MNRDQLPELQYITPIANIPSILINGILSHRRAKVVPHDSVAMDEIQQIRAKVSIPRGRRLHEYANLYIHARNPMMFKRKAEHQTLCVLRISPDVLDLPGVIVADRNAASSYCRFAPAPDGLSLVDHDMVFATYWTHRGDQLLELEHKSIKCAEVLVPERLDPSFIIGTYVSCQESLDTFHRLGVSLAIDINAHLFFYQGR